MKKKSLKLSDLKVESFVTSLDKNEKETIVGGKKSNNPACNTQAGGCTNANTCIVVSGDISGCICPTPPISQDCTLVPDTLCL